MTVTALPQPASGGHATAADRWRPTRAGIVNVWRYYDETFTFHEGRLLLRGPNGTGKSKALEVLLPFLLDANLRASRLSTFGGQERTMHWNLMGDGYDGRNRVGYVWLEFARAQAHATIGARLQASVNTKSVTATYFLTDQRVGVPGGLQLLGEAARPLTRKDLEDAIGAHGRVYDGATAEYRRDVMHALFRGFDADKYEALIFALLQLRTPKLSEHLDPDELSTLLSRALPPLDPHAIGEIAEGFEKLDRRREELAALEADVAAAARLADRQRRYAQRVVRAAAARLVSATTRMDDLTRKARQSREQHDTAVAEQQAAEQADARLRHEADVKGARLAALLDSDAYKAGQQLDLLRQEAQRARRQAADARVHADRAAGHVAEDSAAADAAAQAARHGSAEVQRVAADTARAAAHAGLDAAFEQAAAADDLARGRSLVSAAVEARERQIGQARQALEDHRRAVDARRAAERRLASRRETLEAAEGVVAERTAQRDEAAEALRTALRAWAGGCVELVLDADALDAAATDEAAVSRLVAVAADAVRAAVATQDADLAARRRRVAGDRQAAADEHAAVAAAREVVPDPPASRTADRAGRAGAPLWRLVAFAEGIEAREQAAVEAALADSGLLDAWVSPDGSVRAADGHDRFAAGDLATPAPGASLATVLRPEADAAVPGDRIARLLAAVAYGPTAPDHAAAVGRDGSWRLATLTGSWDKPDAELIGATARERARQRRLADLAARLAQLDADLAVLDAGLAACVARRQQLADEQAARPPHAPLRQATQRLEQAEATAASRADAVAEADAELDAADRSAAEALRALTSVAARHGLPADAAALDQVADALRGFRRAAETWLDARRRLEAAVRRETDAVTALARSRASAAAAAEAAETSERDACAVGVRLATMEEQHGRAFAGVLDEVRLLRDRLQAVEHERETLARVVRDLEGRIGELRERMQVDDDERDAAAGARDEAGAALRGLGTLGLDVEAGIDVDLAALDGVRATREAASRIAEALPTTPFEPKDLKAAEARLSETVHEVRQSLAGRADVSLEPDESGLVVLVAATNGLRLGAVGLHANLEALLRTERAELTEEEHALFDRTLAGEARRQVAQRIRGATELVDAMNAQLARVQTASRMRVRLRWQVDPELPVGMREARDLLLKDPASLPVDERAALHDFFRARVDEVRAADGAAGWEQQLLEVLDYRAWHTFVVQIDRGGDEWQPVTKRTHGQLSGGERAIALHLPLFAAAAAHYDGADGAPRLILLDEVFVGVDATNRGQLLDLVVRLDLDAVMTSDHEWCTYTELDGIAIHQLMTGDDGDDAVTTARFVWDGTRVVAAEALELVAPQ